MILPPRDAARLRRLVPLLGSPVDGEAIAARNAIQRLLENAGLDWHDLAEACVGPSGDQTTRQSVGGASFGDLARTARDLDRGRLTPRERAFVHDVCRRGFSFQPTQPQADWLRAILARLQPRAAA